MQQAIILYKVIEFLLMPQGLVVESAAAFGQTSSYVITLESASGENILRLHCFDWNGGAGVGDIQQERVVELDRGAVFGVSDMHLMSTSSGLSDFYTAWVGPASTPNDLDLKIAGWTEGACATKRWTASVEGSYWGAELTRLGNDRILVMGDAAGLGLLPVFGNRPGRPIARQSWEQLVRGAEGIGHRSPIFGGTAPILGELPDSVPGNRGFFVAYNDLGRPPSGNDPGEMGYRADVFREINETGFDETRQTLFTGPFPTLESISGGSEAKHEFLLGPEILFEVNFGNNGDALHGSSIYDPNHDPLPFSASGPEPFVPHKHWNNYSPARPLPRRTWGGAPVDVRGFAVQSYDNPGFREDTLSYGDLSMNLGFTSPARTTWPRSGPDSIYNLEDTHVFSSAFYLSGMNSFTGAGLAHDPSAGGSPARTWQEPWDFKGDNIRASLSARASTEGELVHSSVVFQCQEDAVTVCLNGGRFEVRAAFKTPDGQIGVARMLPLTDESAYGYFFKEENVELVVKALSPCGSGNHWIFAAGLTDVAVDLIVRDTGTGRFNAYSSAPGEPFELIRDTSAFDCGSKEASRGPRDDAPVDELLMRIDEALASSNDSAEGASTADLGRTTESTARKTARNGDCTEDDTTLCLNDDQFEITVEWRTPGGKSGVGHAVELTPDTGYFWFFQDDNVELMIKVLDPRASKHFWVFAAGLTDIEVTTRVRNTVTGAVKTYRNKQGQPFELVRDTAAFPKN